MGQGQSHNLFEAAASDELERAKYFIEHDKTDVNATDKVRGEEFATRPIDICMALCSRLRCASPVGSLAAFGCLMQDGWTPLHFAAYGGSVQVARELLALGARPRTADKVHY